MSCFCENQEFDLSLIQSMCYTGLIRAKDKFDAPIQNLIKIHGKGKVKFPLCLTKHHAMKTYWGVEVHS